MRRTVCTACGRDTEGTQFCPPPRQCERLYAEQEQHRRAIQALLELNLRHSE
jgi:hypothetical protein